MSKKMLALSLACVLWASWGWCQGVEVTPVFGTTGEMLRVTGRFEGGEGEIARAILDLDMIVSGTPDPRFGFLQLGVFPGSDREQAIEGVSPFGCMVEGSRYRLDVTSGLTWELGEYSLACYIAARDQATGISFTPTAKAKPDRSAVRLVRRRSVTVEGESTAGNEQARGGGTPPSSICVGPNPLGGGETFRVLTNEKSVEGRLVIYDMRGRKVAECRPNGGEYEWNGRAANGRRAPAGAYFFVLEVPGRGRLSAGKLMLVR